MKIFLDACIRIHTHPNIYQHRLEMLVNWAARLSCNERRQYLIYILLFEVSYHTIQFSMDFSSLPYTHKRTQVKWWKVEMLDCFNTHCNICLNIKVHKIFGSKVYHFHRSRHHFSTSHKVCMWNVSSVIYLLPSNSCRRHPICLFFMLLMNETIVNNKC